MNRNFKALKLIIKQIVIYVNYFIQNYMLFIFMLITKMYNI